MEKEGKENTERKSPFPENVAFEPHFLHLPVLELQLVDVHWQGETSPEFTFLSLLKTHTFPTAKTRVSE